MKIIIKQALVKDAQEILDLQKLCYKSEADIYNLCSVPPMHQTLEAITREFESYLILKVLIPSAGKGVIGSVRAKARGRSVYIGRLIVHPDFQNQGLGTRLMNEIESRFPKARRFWLMTGHKSQRNIHLYQKLGYKIFKKKQVAKPIAFVYLEKRCQRA
jgi:ribosomal protein S18 acetylase RimI-like enzyme